MRWLIGTLLVLVVGSILRLSSLVYAMYVLLGILLLSRFLTRRWTEALTIARGPTAEQHERGETATMIVTLSNDSEFSIPWLIFEESLPRSAMKQTPPKLTVKGKRLGILKLPKNSSHHIEYRVTFHERGYYQFGPLLVETGDLFGLHRRYKIVTEPRFVLVLPKIVPLLRYQIASNRPIGEIRISHRLFEDPTRIAAVRPYQPGDPLNQIHWKASARTGQLHSRVYENSSIVGATLVLDYHHDAYEGNGAGVVAELAITATASIANAIFEEGHQIGLITNGRDAAERIKHEGWQGDFTTRHDAQQQAQHDHKSDRIRPMTVPTRKGSDQMTQILETLGRLEPGQGLSFDQLLKEAGHLLPRDATVIPILRSVSPGTVLALSLLRRRGYAITVVLIQFDEGFRPGWAKAPSWAEPLIAEGLEFITVPNESVLSEMSPPR